MTATRLAKGGYIDRDQLLNFTWDGRTLHGHAGDSLASALLAKSSRSTLPYESQATGTT